MKLELYNSEIKAFQQAISQIEDNRVLQITNFIKLSKDFYLTKTNLQMFCLMKIHCKNAQTDLFKDVEKNDELKEDILLDSKKLFALVNSSPDEYIELNVLDDKIIMKDSSTRISQSRVDIKEYPVIPAMNNETEMIIDKSLIQVFEIAKSFISTDPKNFTSHSFVHISKNTIAGMSEHTFFIKKYHCEFPDLLLTSNQINILSKFRDIKFSTSNNYYVFNITDPLITYAFIKTDYSSPNFNSVFLQCESWFDKFENKVSLQKKSIVDFCEFVNSVSDRKIPICKLQPNESNGKATLQLVDSGGDAIREIPIKGNVCDYFFNSKLIYQSFKQIPDNDLNCSLSKQAMIVKLEDSYICYMGIGGDQKNE